MDKKQNASKTKAPFQRKPLISALEPRILLDGAAVAATADMTTDVAFHQNPEAADTTPQQENVDAETIAPSSSRREVAFVDTRVTDYQTLIDGLPENIDVYIVNIDENGLLKIADVLSRQSVDTIHILSHGNVGEFDLGNITVNQSTLESHSALLKQIGSAISTDGDILLYGCQTGADQRGADFVNRFSALTGADVAASDDLTGTRTLGGDWELETRAGIIDSESLAITGFQSVMAPVISNLAESVSFSEGSTPVVVDRNMSISSDGSSYTEGYIRFSVEDSNGGDQFTLTSDQSVNTNGAISVVGSDVYLGNGNGRDRIGSIDATENGQNGKALKILFSSPLPNAGFEDGTAHWEISSQVYGDGAENSGDPDPQEINFDNYPISFANDSVYQGKDGNNTTGTTNTQDSVSVVFSGEVDTKPGGNNDNNALYLSSHGDIAVGNQDAPGSSQKDGYGSIHGPYARSSVVKVAAGDSISLEFYAQGTGDHYEVFGLLREVKDNDDSKFASNELNSESNILLFAERGFDTTHTEDSKTKNFKTITASNLKAGDYRFEFIGGTYDYSGGYAVGSNLYVDNIRLISKTTVSDSVATTIARQVAYQNTADDAPVARNINVQAIDTNGGGESGTIRLDISPENQSNDAPALSGNVLLDAVDEDTRNPPGATISSLFAPGFTDPDAAYDPKDTLAGIVVTGDSSNSTEGEWQYSTDGQQWYGIDDVSSESGLLLASDSLIRFTPAAEYSGTPGALSVHAVDSSSDSIEFTSGAGRTTFDTTTDNQASPVSASAVQLGTSINSVNDTPLFSDLGSGTTLEEQGTTISGSGQFVLSDMDPENIVTLAHTVVAVQQNSNGNPMTSSQQEPSNAVLQSMLSLSADPALSAGEISAQLSWSFNSGGEAFDYLRSGEQLVLTYTLQADDGQGGIGTRDLSIIISGRNDAPVAIDDAATAIESGGLANSVTGQSATGNVLDNDSDVEIPSGDRLAVTGISAGSLTLAVPTDEITAINGIYGTLLIRSNGSYTYEVDENNPVVQALRTADQQLTDNFSYQMQDHADSNGTAAQALNDTGLLTITITGQNDAPVALDNNSYEGVSLGSNYQRDASQLFTDADSFENGEDFSFVITGLPDGLVYDADSGIITGIPAEPGRFTITLTLTDQAGEMATREYLLEIIPTPQEQVVSQPDTPAELPSVNIDTVPVETPSTELPDGLVNELGTRDPADSTGFSDGRQTAPVQILAEAELSETEAPTTAMASVDVNVNNHGDVVFSKEQQQAFDIVSLKIVDVSTSDDQVRIEVTDTAVNRQHYTGTQTDGSALPGWITIDPDTGSISAKPPEDLEQMAIRLKATSYDGSTRILEIRLDLEELRQEDENSDDSNEADENFVSLNQQLEQHAQSRDQHGEQLVSILNKNRD